MLNLWNSFCLEKIGSPVEVVTCDRKEYPYHGVSTHIGEFNSSIPQIWQGKVVLALLLESTKKLDMIIVTHELGHWVLPFSKEIVQKLDLRGNWQESNDLERLKEQVAETRLKYKSG